MVAAGSRQRLNITRKDFELIASVLGGYREHLLNLPVADLALDNTGLAVSIVEDIALDFALTLTAQNPRFDRERFLKACGVK